jgi:hypothetical protein
MPKTGREIEDTAENSCCLFVFFGEKKEFRLMTKNFRDFQSKVFEKYTPTPPLDPPSILQQQSQLTHQQNKRLLCAAFIP